MDNLRPIGTIFKQDLPLALTSTDSRYRCITYRVVAHADVVIDCSGKTKKPEEVKAVKVDFNGRKGVEA